MTGGERSDEESAKSAAVATVFVSDPSVEAERVGQKLRGVGYVVVDVPLTMLVARVAVQRPRIVLLDADSEGALDVIVRMRELPDADAIDILFFSRDGGAIASPEDALAHEGSGMFTRPLDLEAVVKKVDALTGGVALPPPRRPSSRPPPSMPSPSSRAALPPAPPSAPLIADAPSSQPSSAPASQQPGLPSSQQSGVPSSQPSSLSLPPASMRAPEPISSRPPSPRPSAPHLSVRPSMPVEMPMGFSVDSARRAQSSPLSSELERLLAEAELRAPNAHAYDAPVPTPEEEIEAVLPADLLEGLDEPLADEDDDASDGVGVGTGRATGARPTTSTHATGSGSTPRRTTGTRDEGDSVVTPAPPKTHDGTHSGTTGSSRVPTTGTAERAQKQSALDASAHFDAPPRSVSQPPPTAYEPPTFSPPVDPPRGYSPPERERYRADSNEDRESLGDARHPPSPLASVLLGKGDAPRYLARAIATRLTGSLAIEAPEGIRRAIVREGDLVTVASTVEDESLLAFLGVRGELPRETVRRLAPKFPGFGRHAGAALVAHGYLRQEQLWPVLRAHAEWILGRALQTQTGNAFHEPEAPDRLRAEPGVFGGSTGAEVLVEVLRRVVPPNEALERMGGAASRLDVGERIALLSECALDARDLDLMAQSRGRAVSQLLEAAPDSDIATVVYALSVLGVISVLRAVGGADAAGPDANRAGDDAIDEEAIRARVGARLEVVNDGDYFQLLGVSHDATGYEIRRAFLELRSAFEPARLLTPQVADLAEDVKKIVAVLEEAYDILRDAPRRERYRRAIDAVPGG